MAVDIGFSVVLSEERDQAYYERLFEDMLGFGADEQEEESPFICTAIELHARDRFPVWEPLVGLIKQFGYVAVHANDLVAQGDQRETEYFQGLAEAVEAETVNVHPYLGQDLAKLALAFPGTYAAEILDAKNPYGKTVEDMEEILATVPGIGWVLDLNHIYTNDPSMELARRVLATLPLGQLRHTHVSGHEGYGEGQLPHHTLLATGQTEILKPTPLDKPVIIESLGLWSPKSPRTVDFVDFRPEGEYVKRYLERRCELVRS